MDDDDKRWLREQAVRLDYIAALVRKDFAREPSLSDIRQYRLHEALGYLTHIASGLRLTAGPPTPEMDEEERQFYGRLRARHDPHAQAIA